MQREAPPQDCTYRQVVAGPPSPAAAAAAESRKPGQATAGCLCCVAGAADRHLQAGSGATSPQGSRSSCRGRQTGPGQGGQHFAFCPAADGNVSVKLGNCCMQLLALTLSNPRKLYDRGGW